jgi:hypothetical protein
MKIIPASAVKQKNSYLGNKFKHHNEYTNRQHNGQKDKEQLKDTKEVIRIHKSKKDRQHNGQKDKEQLKDTKDSDYLFGIFHLFFVLLAIMLCILL